LELRMNERPDVERIIEPALPIIDPHHHLWYVPPAALATLLTGGGEASETLGQIYQRRPRYLFDELLADATSGHDVRATVYIEVHAMHRRDGPETLRSVGEIEFANGMAAMGASGAFGEVRVCAGIVGGVDLQRGAAAREVLEAQQAAGGGRYRGIRSPGVAHDEATPSLNGVLHSRPGVLGDRGFREGFAELAPLGLHYEAFQLEPQLPELLDLARAFPGTSIVLNHAGMPAGVEGLAGTHAERFPIWRRSIRELSTCLNVVVKLGGLGNPLCGFAVTRRGGAAGSEEIAREWAPYLETCIEAFGADRCMFESNFPVDGMTASYPVIWNAFKRIAAGASEDEKRALFSGTAARVYQIEP
jgi:predicted TIM-barrel fold metal-dependent hydrolase